MYLLITENKALSNPISKLVILRSVNPPKSHNEAMCPRTSSPLSLPASQHGTIYLFNHWSCEMYKVNTQVETLRRWILQTQCLTESRVMFRKEYRLAENKDTSFYVIQGIHQAALSSSVHLQEHRAQFSPLWVPQTKHSHWPLWT